MIEYEEVGDLPDGTIKIKFTTIPFDGIIIALAGVSFVEELDEVKLHYEYKVIEHTQYFNKEELDVFVGDFVMQEITSGIEKNDLIYTGGVDEIRNQNIEQSDL